MYAAWMWLLIDPELIEFSTYPPEHICERNYYQSAKYLEEFDRWMDSFGNPWAVRQRVDGWRDYLGWQKRYWSAVWTTVYCGRRGQYHRWAGANWQEWLVRTREIRSGR